MLYRKKPVVVDVSDAWWEDGDHPNVKPPSEAKWIFDNRSWYTQTPFEHEPGYCKKCLCSVLRHGWIGTLEGGHIVCPGDRIITGVQGEQYPIKPDIFEQTYEKVLEVE